MRRIERGAALVEAALVLPIVLLFIFAILEFGFLWRNVNQVERSLQSAGRTGSNLGTNRFADFEMLRAIDSGLDGMESATIERVIVFNSTDADGAVPANCLTVDVASSPMSPHGVGGTCNVYSGAQVAVDSPSGFPVSGANGCAGGSWDGSWCPSARDNSDPGLTYLGVFVKVVYTPTTNLIQGPTLDVTRSTVYRVEPCVPIVSSCT